MNRVQEMIDERKDELPVGLAKELLDACKEEAESRPKLYHVTYTSVRTIAYHSDDGPEARMVSETKTVIAQSVTNVQRGKCAVGRFLYEAKFLESWMKLDLPNTLHYSDEMIVILHSITPFP